MIDDILAIGRRLFASNVQNCRIALKSPTVRVEVIDGGFSCDLCLICNSRPLSLKLGGLYFKDRKKKRNTTAQVTSR